MKIIKVIFGTVFILSLISCHTTKMIKNPPFKVEKAIYEDTGNLKYRITIKTSNPQIVLDSVYFKNSKAKLSFKEGYFTAFITKPSLLKKNLILHNDPKKEFGNTPSANKKIPFDLKREEAVISYSFKDKTYYYKTKIKEI